MKRILTELKDIDWAYLELKVGNNATQESWSVPLDDSDDLRDLLVEIDFLRNRWWPPAGR